MQLSNLLNEDDLCGPCSGASPSEEAYYVEVDDEVGMEITLAVENGDYGRA